MDNLAKKTSPRLLLKALEELPQGFTGTYDAALMRIDEQSKESRELAYCVLSWISYAFQPLSLLELQYAVAVKKNMTGMDDSDLHDEEFLLSICAGLVTISTEAQHTKVGFVRKSVIQI